jgi:transposase-like protein
LENAPDLSEATARKNQLIERYREEAPKAMALLDTRFDEITAVYSLPEPYRKRLRTSNSIERLNEELRRTEWVIQEHPSY